MRHADLRHRCSMWNGEVQDVPGAWHVSSPFMGTRFGTFGSALSSAQYSEVCTQPYHIDTNTTLGSVHSGRTANSLPTKAKAKHGIQPTRLLFLRGYHAVAGVKNALTPATERLLYRCDFSSALQRVVLAARVFTNVRKPSAFP